MLKSHICLVAVLLLPFPVAAVSPSSTSDTIPYRDWIADMKAAERGPFEKIAWFCKDGTILPPKPYACSDHGGGHQHGVWNERTRILREQGFYIANVLATLPPEQAIADHAEQLKWILLERFLLEQDDGWILRKARHYRGAFQSEVEAIAARDILKAMLADPQYRTSHYLLTREAARLLPWRTEPRSLEQARILSSSIAELDTNFIQLRNKIHSYPEKTDIEQVRDYHVRNAQPETTELLKSLEASLLATFESPNLIPALRKLTTTGKPDAEIYNRTLTELTDSLAAAETDRARLQVLGKILTALHDSLADWPSAAALQALDISLTAEQAAMAAELGLLAESKNRTRAWQLEVLADNLHVLYGLGFITARERDAQQTALAELSGQPTLSDYRETLDYLARLPAWVDARLQYYFAPQIDRFDILEPKIKLFIQDRLRMSPLILHSRLLESLSIDADNLAGVQHELLGQPVGRGFRALNPGLARGRLQHLKTILNPGTAMDKTIVLAPETIADLPPVAGILTTHAGNTLSHIQLLARNLGIPNVVVSDDLLPRLDPLIGQRIVLLASPGGVVRLMPDEPRWDKVFPEQEEKPVRIKVDMEKLNLDQKGFLTLDQLQAADSGRVVGPKAAKLGELKNHFADQVPQGLAIPFGVYRQMLEQTPGPDELSLFDWMRNQYRQLETIKDNNLREQATRSFLAEVRTRIQNQALDENFKTGLRERMREVFGEEGSYGVFVRSDTNVEDLPGFTGAGLNLTVPNVVGFEQTLEAIKNVWASPFSDRAYGWRQSLMEQPEHVYAAVLLHKTAPADKSGVMITADITSNDPGIYTIATNEGVGGGVEGQAAESLKVDPHTGESTLLASATETYKTILPPQGGIARAVASGNPELLAQNEIKQLITFGLSLPERYPGLLDAEGNAVPADIEFAFVNGKLYLLQIRPFLQSQRAQRNLVLLDLDKPLQRHRDQVIDLMVAPGTDTP
ncbi:MAG TPA: PEP/pyruvate-binding domain-containing protein [Gammaproteobacteria bacterium]|nr:PEP/pyruvate-binding domain-containing protein [Gammaproteobacteria bacterium]